MDQDQRAYVEVEMEDDNGSVQECTEEDANDLLGPRSSSGLSDHLQAVSLEGQVGGSDSVPARVLHETAEYTTVQFPKESWDSMTENGGARERTPGEKSGGSQRGFSLDRAAAARMVRAAAQARSASVAARGGVVAAATGSTPVNPSCGGACRHEAAEVREFLSPEEHVELRSTIGSAKVTLIGRPARLTHVVVGDSNVRRMADLDILKYDGYQAATEGLLLVHLSGGTKRFADLVKQFTRMLYGKYTNSFEDPENRIQLAICMGYNDPESTLKEYFRDSVRILIELKHAFAGVAAPVEMQLGEILYGKSSLQYISAHRNFIHFQLSRLTGNMTPLRLWVAQLGPEMPEGDLKPVNATNIDLRIQRNTLEQDAWHHNEKILTAARNVLFDWCRGVVTEGVGTPHGSPYRFLRDNEAYLPGATMTLDMDVFGERDRLFLDHTNNPLSEEMAERLDKLPLPAIRLEILQGRVQKRAVDRDDRSSNSSGSVFDRLDNQQQAQRGRGAREARGRVRFNPYAGHGGRGGRGGRW